MSALRGMHCRSRSEAIARVTDYENRHREVDAQVRGCKASVLFA